MKNSNDMEQNVANEAELVEASEAELEQINGGVFPGMVLRDLLFRKTEDEENDIVLLPMQTEPGKKGKKSKKDNLGKVIKL